MVSFLDLDSAPKMHERWLLPYAVVTVNLDGIILFVDCRLHGVCTQDVKTNKHTMVFNTRNIVSVDNKLRYH